MGLVYVALFAGLVGLSGWQERAGRSYPFRSEDWLRYLLPSFLEPGDSGRILLTGASAIRESLLYERFERAFPGYKAFQGGLSLGTFADVRLALEYTEAVHGGDALPDILIMGVSPRFVANIPAMVSPLALGINLYDSRYRVEFVNEFAHLVRKTAMEGIRARVRFARKQQARFRAAAAGLLGEVVRSDVPYDKLGDDFDAMRAVVRVAQMDGSALPEAAAFVRRVGVRATLGRWLRVYRSPYKYHYLPPMSDESLTGWLQDPNSFWVRVHRWNPDTSAQLVVDQFAWLRDYVAQRNIELYLVNIPENELSRRLYEPGYYERYYELLREAVGSTPLLDIRELLSSDKFYDVVHPNLPSAVEVTDVVIDFVRRARTGMTAGGR